MNILGLVEHSDEVSSSHTRSNQVLSADLWVSIHDLQELCVRYRIHVDSSIVYLLILLQVPLLVRFVSLEPKSCF